VDPVYASSIFVLGLAFGSFLNVCIYRLPLDLSVVTPRSACPRCKRPIAFYDNLPVLSWLFLRGRCRQCKARISPRYLLFSLLVPVHDLASQFLPGMLNLPFSADLAAHLLSLLDSLLGAALGASFIYGAGAAYLRWRGAEGMGFGDVKLMAMVGAFLGMKLTIFTIFTASLAGSFFGLTTVFVVWLKRTHRFMKRLANAQAARRRGWQSAQVVYRNYQMPFGVFLGSMALIAFFFGNRFLHWYGGLW
jgi:leader peptidase (prepilin peptidase)/N-methyltransferase